MLASIISTIGEKWGQGCRAGFSVEYRKTQILLKVSTTNLKSFLYLGDCFLWYPKVIKTLESLVPFIYLALPGRLSNLITTWNDWRSRRVFLLLFCLVIFLLSSTKFQTFAYNSRTVCFSFVKFWQQFENNELHVCAKFWGNMSRNFGFWTRNLHKSLA